MSRSSEKPLVADRVLLLHGDGCTVLKFWWCDRPGQLHPGEQAWSLLHKEPFFEAKDAQSGQRCRSLAFWFGHEAVSAVSSCAQSLLLSCFPCPCTVVGVKATILAGHRETRVKQPEFTSSRSGFPRSSPSSLQVQLAGAGGAWRFEAHRCPQTLQKTLAHLACRSVVCCSCIYPRQC